MMTISLDLAVMLIIFTGLIMFWIGIVTPFLVVKMAKFFNMEFDEFFNDEKESF